MVMAHPTTQTQHAARFDAFIAGLRYGGIAINEWAAALFGLGQTTWGAFPGHPLDNIESGRGVVHNTFLFDHPQKSVVRFPWRINPKPIWSPSHKTLDGLGKALLRMEAAPSIFRLPSVLAAALRG